MTLLLREFDSGITLISSAVAECSVATDRKHLYAESLGQAFSFDILQCNFDAEEYRDCIEQSLKDNSSFTWVFSNHDVCRAS